MKIRQMLRIKSKDSKNLYQQTVQQKSMCLDVYIKIHIINNIEEDINTICNCKFN